MKKNLRSIICTVVCTLVVVYFVSQLFGNNIADQAGTFNVGSLLPFAIFLICPLMHLFMMKSMHGGNGGGCCSGKDRDTDKSNIDNDNEVSNKTQRRSSCH